MKLAAEHNWARKFPELGTGPISVEPCVSPEYFGKEKEKIFKRVWQKLGRVEEFPGPGSWKLKPMPIWDTSILLVRGNDGQIRGFHNVCSHRGNAVVWGDQPYGRGRHFFCHFHGWTYDLEGHLIDVPEEEEFYDTFKRCENGLTPVAVEVWEGFVFAHLDPNPETSLADYLGEAGDRLSGFPYGEMTATYSYNTILNCNWKVAQDAFSEAYHVTTIHAGSFPKGFASKLWDVTMIGPHHSGAVHMTDQGEPTPVSALAHRLATSSIAKRGERTELPPMVNPNRNPSFAFELAVLFPNFLVHIMDGLYFTHQFEPISVDQTRWEGIQYFRPPRNAGERFSQEHGQLLQRNAWLEDTATMEATHAALKSGAKKAMHLQDEEVLIRHCYKVVDEYVNA
ncbi:aromatic ring-hydroxylating dioxygenase subunit alpha [Hoeflea sp.]|uniref:aromatic ring-hydroxylating oxygenase subunit alpha n=1 Tax=Hoeflea sp. TaxID=1940281 RepID=UPI0019CA1A9F|nr:aromatic ring-hydroxylating dioxygenase subunit alpha [Hoeflea sp.]MBC7284841.1 aromatic ring-hydroxylating dioxygenase subunit alpha [Hoeflea sp.]